MRIMSHAKAEGALYRKVVIVRVMRKMRSVIVRCGGKKKTAQ